MKSTSQDNFTIPTFANFAHQGEGKPVILIHGFAASLHDWDALTPELTKRGYSSYALDLLGHGDSPKPDARFYQMDWLFDHFSNWMQSLRLTEPAFLIGHSLGGHIALEYARRVSAWTRGLILVNPFYSRSQLNFLFRRSYSQRNLRGLLAGRTPKWMIRAIVDVASAAMGRMNGSLQHSLPERVRAQSAFDYTRTAPGVYDLPGKLEDLTEYLPSISLPTLVVWGDHDQTLAPSSFPKMVNAMPRAVAKPMRAGHILHQSHVQEFNQVVMEFLSSLA